MSGMSQEQVAVMNTACQIMLSDSIGSKNKFNNWLYDHQDLAMDEAIKIAVRLKDKVKKMVPVTEHDYSKPYVKPTERPALVKSFWL